MKHGVGARHFFALAVITVATFLVAATVARADVVYIWDSGFPTERFNNSQLTETEDNWVANAFEVVEDGTRLVSIDYPLGETFVERPASAIIYLGVDISDPSAGGGLVRIHTTETLVTGERGTIATIVLDTPVDLNVGDVFYAALLIRKVTGDLFPFFNDGVSPQGHSFFDVGPKQGAAYDLDMTQNATVLGASHPVVTFAQSPGNLFLRVNGTGRATGGDIVFVSTRDGNAEIYSVRADGTGLTRLTNNPAHDDAPVWSPDGTRIAFISHRDGSPEVYVMNSDGSNVVRRTFTASYSQDPSWSPDGTKIAYSTLSDGSANLWVVNPDEGSPTLLFAMPGWEGHAAWSPDGSQLALVSDWLGYDFVYDIYLINADGSGFTRLTGDIFDHIDYLRPSWSPNGAQLAVAITQTVGIDQYVTNLGVMNPDGSGLTALIPAATWAKSSWSPDGQKIAFTSGVTGATNISWVSPDGSSSGTIVTNGYSPNWR